MPSSFTPNLGIERPADGELDAVWGDVVNENMDILDRAVNGQVSLSLVGTSSTLTTAYGALTDGQYKLLVLAGTPSGTHTITIAPNDAQKIYFVRNTTAQSVVFTQGSGGNVTLAAGDSGIIYANGALSVASVQNLSDHFSLGSVKITGGAIDGTTIGATSATSGVFTTGSFTTGTFSGDVTIADKIVHGGDTDTSIRFPAADTVTVETAGAERLRVNSAGLLGVGTATPLAALHVNKASTSADIRLSVADVSYSSLVSSASVTALNTLTALPLTLGTNSAERLRIDATGNVGVGAAANAAAILDLTSTTKGFRAPSLTTVQRDAIVSPVGGLLIYNTTQLSYQVYNGTSWTSVGGGATGGGSNQVFVENDQTVTDNYTITSGKHAMSTGPITINSGVIVTVPSGSNWVVI